MKSKFARVVSAFTTLLVVATISYTASTATSEAAENPTNALLNGAVTYAGSDVNAKTMRVTASSCISGDFCMFVGSSSNGYLQVSFGDPSNFGLMSQIRFSQFGEFSDVSCLSTTWCAVVGTTFNDPFVISGDPSTFSDSALINLATSTQTIHLNSITCLTQTSCLAAGATDALDGVYFSGDPASWTPAKNVTVNPANDFGLARQFVRCISANYCVLAGQVQKGMTIYSVFWSGSISTFAKSKTAEVATKTWTRTATNIYGLWCFAIDSCLVQVGIGVFDDRSAVLKGSPKSWKILEVVGGASALGGMDCLSITSCSASVGINISGKNRTFVYSLSDPETWAKTKPTEISYLITPRAGDSVNCSVKSCYLFGYAADNSIRMLSAAQGDFSYPMFQPATENLGYQNQININAMHCLSDSSCVAVGSFFKNGSYLSMSSVFNPENWDQAKLDVFSEKIDFDTETTPPISALRSISCVNETSCVAVGNSASLEPSFAVGDPNSWKLKTISKLPVSTSLGFVSCATKDYCVAVGAAGDQEAKDTKLVIFSGNPASWASAKPKIVDLGVVIEPSGLSCVAKASCVMTFTTMFSPRSGNFFSGDPLTLTAKSLKQFSTLANFNSLNCFSKTRCFAVGVSASSAPPKKGVAGQQSPLNPIVYLGEPGSWLAKTAIITPSQNPAKVNSLLRGKNLFSNDRYVFSRPSGFNSADCLSATECYAVGFDASGNAVTAKFNPSLNLNISAVTQSIPQGWNNANFDAVSCGSSKCYAMGNSDKGTFLVRLTTPVQ